MTQIVVATPALQALAQRVDGAIRVVRELERGLAGSPSRTADLVGPAEPVAAGLRALLAVVGDNVRGSADDLARLRDGLLVVAEAWDELEHGTTGALAP